MATAGETPPLRAGMPLLLAEAARLVCPEGMASPALGIRSSETLACRPRAAPPSALCSSALVFGMARVCLPQRHRLLVARGEERGEERARAAPWTVLRLARRRRSPWGCGS